VNTSETGEQVRPSAASTLPRRPTLLTWQGWDTPFLESVRLSQAGAKLRASGRVISAADQDREPFSASFEVSVDESRGVTRLLLRSTTAEEERQISLSRTEDGLWLVDSGRGAERTDFDGAADIDVQSCVLFNTLPVRRLNLHREAGEHDLPVVFVRLPDLSVRLVRQTYRTVSLDPDGAVVHFASGDFHADLTVDTDALVRDYPGLSRRV
jgi:hypothetical protein